MNGMDFAALREEGVVEALRRLQSEEMSGYLLRVIDTAMSRILRSEESDTRPHETLELLTGLDILRETVRTLSDPDIDDFLPEDYVADEQINQPVSTL